MKVLLINGSPHEKGCTYTALCEVAKILETEGIETEIFQIGKSLYAAVLPAGPVESLESVRLTMIRQMR